MFLHLGVDTIVPLSSVIGIFDIKITKSDITDTYLKNMQKNKKVDIIDISENDAKSFIITEKAVYFSAISSLTLEKRTKQKRPGGQKSWIT
jgi:hypothetical protein